MTAYHIPDEERLDHAGIEQLQAQKLRGLLDLLKSRNTFWQPRIDALPPGDADVTSLLQRLPLTSRSELEEDQQAHPPYGTLPTYEVGRYNRFHQTSGSTGRPLRWLDTAEDWQWWEKCWSIVYRGAGLKPEDRVVFPFSFGPFIGFWAAFEAAASLGNLCLPAGGMTTAARIQYTIDNAATVVCCTPTYALHMADVAASEGYDLPASPVRMLILAGEPGGSLPEIRSRIELAWGARVIDHAGMTEIGAWGFECEESPGALHIIESEFIAEVIDPDTGNGVPDGTAGELVLTNLGRAGMPLLRYRTGDQVTLTRGTFSSGRNFAHIEGGIAGRVDQMIFIRGNNVFPSAIESLVRSHDGIDEFRIIVDRRGTLSELTVDVEPQDGVSRDALAAGLASTLQDRLHFRPVIRMVDRGSLPRFELKSKRVVFLDNEDEDTNA